MKHKKTLTNSNKSGLSEYVNKSEFATLHDCPITPQQFNWLFLQRELNGFSKAFVRINARNYLVHTPTFIKCLSERIGA